MQPSCHMYGSTSSWRKRHRRMGNHQVQAHFIFFPNQYTHPHISSNLFTSFSCSTIIVLCLLAASCYSYDCTVHNFLIKSGCDLIIESNSNPVLGLLGCTEHIFVFGNHSFIQSHVQNVMIPCHSQELL